MGGASVPNEFSPPSISPIAFTRLTNIAVNAILSQDLRNLLQPRVMGHDLSGLADGAAAVLG